MGKATTAEVLDCLRIGQVMRLPGTYNSYELVRLGYRNRSAIPVWMYSSIWDNWFKARGGSSVVHPRLVTVALGFASN